LNRITGGRRQPRTRERQLSPPCHQINEGITRRANLNAVRSGRGRLAPLPRRAALAISLVALSTGLQARPVRDPAHDSPFEATCTPLVSQPRCDVAPLSPSPLVVAALSFIWILPGMPRSLSRLSKDRSILLNAFTFVLTCQLSISGDIFFGIIFIRRMTTKLNGCNSSLSYQQSRFNHHGPW
jgi:hypothetical protein